VKGRLRARLGEVVCGQLLTFSHRKKIAIVGSGCAGLGALWALKHSRHDVFLYESADRLGGHTNTVQWRSGKYTTDVDTGFIVLNTATYRQFSRSCSQTPPHQRSNPEPANFLNFLKAVNVATVPTDMTFAVSRDRGAFEWSGTSLDTLFCQRRNLVSPRFWRMLFDIIRFNQFALDLLIQDDERNVPKDVPLVNGYHPLTATIGEYLEREGYSDAFRDDYLIPMTAAVWSTSPDKCSLEFPAITLVRFLWNHHLLSTITARPQWMTLKNCGKSYMDAIMRGFPDNRVFLNAAVESVANEPDGRVQLKLENGTCTIYDHVILATHGDQAWSIIQDSATREEKSIMSVFKTSLNKAVLHSDLSLLPTRKKTWSSWNYMTKSSPNGKANIDMVSLTYNMNILQHIPRDTFGDVLVTLNPLHRPDPKKTQGEYLYTHPLYTPEAVRAQERLQRIQGKRNISYAGAWTKYGFHEDGFSSGIAVAEQLGARLPFESRDSTYSRGKRPDLGPKDWILRLFILIIQVFVVQIIETMLASLVARRRRSGRRKTKMQ
jgi:predicted NAD/FAD-binding protein